MADSSIRILDYMKCVLFLYAALYPVLAFGERKVRRECLRVYESIFVIACLKLIWI